MNAKRIFFQCLSCLLLAVFVSSVIEGVEAIRQSLIHKFGDAYLVLTAYVILPFFYILGIVITDKIYLKKIGKNVAGMILIFIFNAVGITLVGLFYMIFIETNWQSTFLDSSPFYSYIFFGIVGILASVCGYDLVELFKEKIE